MQHVNRSTPRTPGFDPRLFLRDEELDYGISLMLTSERVLMREAETLSQQLKLPPLAARILITIRFQPGQSVRDLREGLGTTTPTLARILSDLDERGYINRRKSRIDARLRMLELTEEGNRLTDRAVISMRNAVRGAYRKAGASAVAGARAVLEALL